MHTDTALIEALEATEPGVLDLFAGPGGWEAGAAMLGLHDILGVEKDQAACDTAEAAGHRRLKADVSKLALEGCVTTLDGLLGSPPCQSFSRLGKGAGRKALDVVVSAVDYIARGEWPDELLASTGDDRTALVVEPLRYALMLNPRWIALEQVPSVLPVWEEIARALRFRGYHVWTGQVNAERYGVPSVRQRAVLIANRDHPVSPPQVSHSRYHVRTPSKLDPGVLKWTTMAEALEWKIGDGWMPTQEQAFEFLRDRINDQSGTPVDWRWPWRRPALTVAGRGLAPNPGPNANRFNGSTKSRNDGLYLKVEEMAALQSFPKDYPWRGNSSEVWTQIGNAVPPLLAGAVLKAAGAIEQAEPVAVGDTLF